MAFDPRYYSAAHLYSSGKLHLRVGHIHHSFLALFCGHYFDLVPFEKLFRAQAGDQSIQAHKWSFTCRCQDNYKETSSRGKPLPPRNDKVMRHLIFIPELNFKKHKHTHSSNAPRSSNASDCRTIISPMLSSWASKALISITIHSGGNVPAVSVMSSSSWPGIARQLGNGDFSLHNFWKMVAMFPEAFLVWC